jgi:cytochrome c-type biogenesis protein CcmE
MPDGWRGAGAGSSGRCRVTGMVDEITLPRKSGHRLRYAIIGLFCIAAIVWMLVLMQRNVVFFKTVSDAVASRAEDGTRTLRIGGAVVPGSIHETAEGARFELVEGGQTVVVVHHGTEPTLFKDCAPVVADGRWNRETFESDQILIKHGSKYQPPANAKAVCPPDPFK